ncbi:hypothetical protein OUZ56_012956 [Daphnia magna]|uniref:Uncharacterized protein n=1 Tax=Daphnia magna TaxID=35525 RepID=A0ABQ9Z4H5_9CRUS|nr:hypothetical protein OUZ56_012956 [Daphnia magna]
MSHPLLGQRCDRGEEIIGRSSALRKIRRYAVRKGSNWHDGIKRGPESALDESPSGELPELGSLSSDLVIPTENAEDLPRYGGN